MKTLSFTHVEAEILLLSLISRQESLKTHFPNSKRHKTLAECTFKIKTKMPDVYTKPEILQVVSCINETLSYLLGEGVLSSIEIEELKFRKNLDSTIDSCKCLLKKLGYKGNGIIR